MADDWESTTIGEQVTLQRGIDITKPQQRAGNVPVVSSGGISSYHDTAYAKGPGVILGRKGTVGTVFYLERDYWPHDTTLWVRDFHGNDPRFVYYFFQSIASVLAGLDVGTANPALNRNHVHPIAARWPKLAEQQAIAAILGVLDEKIESNRQINRTLEAMAQAIFKSWFVDFDPVVAKAACRQPFGVDKETAALFPDCFADSELGPIPHGWSVVQFSKLVEIQGGGTPKTSVADYWGGTIPWFSVVDTPSPGDVFVLDTAKKITELGLAQSAATLLSVGTTIITARGTVGNLALVGTLMAMNQSCYGLAGKHGCGPFFIYFLTREAVDDLRQRTHGTVFETITRATFETLRVTRPTSDVAGVFEAKVSPLMVRIKANLEESRTLADLRDTLLPKLLSGEIRVKQAEATVGGTV